MPRVPWDEGRITDARHHVRSGELYSRRLLGIAGAVMVNDNDSHIPERWLGGEEPGRPTPLVWASYAAQIA